MNTVRHNIDATEASKKQSVPAVSSNAFPDLSALTSTFHSAFTRVSGFFTGSSTKPTVETSTQTPTDQFEATNDVHPLVEVVEAKKEERAAATTQYKAWVKANPVFGGGFKKGAINLWQRTAVVLGINKPPYENIDAVSPEVFQAEMLSGRHELNTEAKAAKAKPKMSAAEFNALLSDENAQKAFFDRKMEQAYEPVVNKGNSWFSKISQGLSTLKNKAISVASSFMASPQTNHAPTKKPSHGGNSGKKPWFNAPGWVKASAAALLAAFVGQAACKAPENQFPGPREVSSAAPTDQPVAPVAPTQTPSAGASVMPTPATTSSAERATEKPSVKTPIKTPEVKQPQKPAATGTTKKPQVGTKGKAPTKPTGKTGTTKVPQDTAGAKCNPDEKITTGPRRGELTDQAYKCYVESEQYDRDVADHIAQTLAAHEAEKAAQRAAAVAQLEGRIAQIEGVSVRANTIAELGETIYPASPKAATVEGEIITLSTCVPSEEVRCTRTNYKEVIISAQHALTAAKLELAELEKQVQVLKADPSNVTVPATAVKSGSETEIAKAEKLLADDAQVLVPIHVETHHLALQENVKAARGVLEKIKTTLKDRKVFVDKLEVPYASEANGKPYSVVDFAAIEGRLTELDNIQTTNKTTIGQMTVAVKQSAALYATLNKVQQELKLQTQ